MLVVQRGAAGGIQVVAGGGLAEGELAGGRAGGERLGRLLRAVGHERPQVGQAHRPLAGARAAQAGPLDQLQLGEAAAPHRLEVLHCRPRARAHDTVAGRGRQRMLGGCGPDDGHRPAGGHAGQDVAGRGPETEDDGPAGVRTLDPFVVGSFLLGSFLLDYDRGHPPALALEPQQPTGHGPARHAVRWCADGHRVGQVDAGLEGRARGARREQAPQPVARADGMKLRGTGGEDHLIGVQMDELDGAVVPHPPDDERRAGVDGDDLLAGAWRRGRARLGRPAAASSPLAPAPTTTRAACSCTGRAAGGPPSTSAGGGPTAG